MHTTQQYVYKDRKAQMIYYYVITTIFIKVFNMLFRMGTRVATDYVFHSTRSTVTDNGREQREE